MSEFQKDSLCNGCHPNQGSHDLNRMREVPDPPAITAFRIKELMLEGRWKPLALWGGRFN